MKNVLREITIWVKAFWLQLVILFLSIWLLVHAIQSTSMGKEDFEMTQAETRELVQAADQMQFIQLQYQQAQQSFQQSMIRIRTSHNWPDDLLFDGREWHHAPKPAEPKKEEPKK